MPRTNRRLTRKQSEQNYGGGPCELGTTEPSTYKQLIQYYYHLSIAEYGTSFWDTVLRVSEELISIWQAVNPRLPLISERAIHRKVRDLLNLVKDINRKHAKARAKKHLDSRLDKLFDISACTCQLETFPCNDLRVNCKDADCIQEHILCVCSSNAKVPIEERAYLRDQRLKIGSRGAYQLSTVDRVAVKKAEAAETRKRKRMEEEQSSQAETGPSRISESSSAEEVK